MKNLLFLIIAGLITASTYAEQGMPGSTIFAQEFSNYIMLEKRHCDDWLNFKLWEEEKCIEMKKRHSAQAADFKAQFVKKASNGEITKADLGKAIALHKRHKADHRKLAESIYKEKTNIMNAHDEELASFEKNPNVIPQTKVAAEITAYTK